MKKSIRILLVLVLVILISSLGVYRFIYNKPHPDYALMKPEFTLTAGALFERFRSDQAAAEQMYNGKMLEISGKLHSMETTDSLTLAVFVFAQGLFGDEGIRCTLLPGHEPVTAGPGTEIRVKGLCTGYNDTDVILEKCSVL
ncbi:MAG: hypothetical protein JW861_11265 [Bacteroidales bacterium]|nr:hypothetical protein [Bacteroidales bacterium]